MKYLLKCNPNGKKNVTQMKGWKAIEITYHGALHAWRIFFKLILATWLGIISLESSFLLSTSFRKAKADHTSKMVSNWMVPNGLKHFLTNRNRLNVLFVPVVSGDPWAWHPECWIWFITKLGTVVLRVELRGRGQKRWKIWELIASWKTLYILAGFSHSN